MNNDPACAAMGPCEEYEFDLMELVDGPLAPERAEQVRQHLHACSRCRAFRSEFAAISDSLATGTPRAELSGDFEQRLHARISGLARAMPSDTALALAEREYREMVDGLSRGLTWRTALNALATASVCGGVVSALAYVAPPLLQSLGVAEPSAWMTGAGIAAVALGVGAIAARSVHRTASVAVG
jgi:anti-sigma factor RsiW